MFAVQTGDLSTPADLAAVGGAGLVTVGLAVVARRGLRARNAVRRALDEGLGAGWRAVARKENLRYGDAGRRNLLDVYHHRSRPANAPVLVYFHGGGYHSGRKDREAAPLLHRLAGQGRSW